MSKTKTSDQIKREQEKRSMERIYNMMKTIEKGILNGQPPELEMPGRGMNNAIYDKEKHRLVLGDKKTKRKYLNVAHTRKFMQTLKVADACYNELLKKHKTTTIRDLFYSVLGTIPGTKIQTFDDQNESNQVSVDLEVALGLAREDFNLVAESSGSVVGNVVIEDHNDIIDWSKMGSGGWSVPSIVDHIVFKKVNAKFILYVEKKAVWNRLREDEVWKKYNCVLVATRGQSDRGTRRLIKRMSEEFDLPVYVFTDSDPYGWYIYSVIKYGSMALPHTSEYLATPNAKFAGMSMDDLEKYNIPKSHTLPMKPTDIKRAKEMMKYPWFQSEFWQKQLKKAIESKRKAELQSLAKYGIEFISETYIPDKIKNKDFVD